MNEESATPQKDQSVAEFEKIAEGGGASLVGELLGFMKASKKWWLLPVVIVLLSFALLVLLSGTSAAPFIYTLF